MISTGNQKKKSTSVLIGELDDLISEYVRRSHADEKGFVKCVSCDWRGRWQDADCCHFMSRIHMGTRFNTLNLEPGCKNCNRFDQEMHHDKFREYLIMIGGQALIDKLEREAHSLKKFMAFELQEMITHYKIQIAQL